MSTGKQTGGGQARAPRRKRVVLADRRGAREFPRTVMEPEEPAGAGEQQVADLIRAQLRTSLTLAGITAGALCGLPALFWAFPGIASSTVLGVPLPWLVLGVLPFPSMVLVGYLSTRRAEQHEREFVKAAER